MLVGQAPLFKTGYALVSCTHASSSLVLKKGNVPTLFGSSQALDWLWLVWFPAHGVWL